MITVIDRKALIKFMNSFDEYKLIDVRNKKNYDEEHIKHALSIPFNSIDESLLNIFKKDDNIIVYSKNFDCYKSFYAAQKLISMGFKKVYVYDGGIKDYKNGSLPLEIIFMPDLSFAKYDYGQLY